MIGRSVSSWPLRGWVGVSLVAVFWALNWGLTGMRTHWAFFGLWLGYCLTVDSWVWQRSGSSLWTRSRSGYLGLFLASVPIWWLFEWINRRTGNWVYLGRDAFSDAEYFILGSLSFSTVVPAVLGTAELMSTFGWIARLRAGWRVPATRRACWGLVAVGATTGALMLGWPRFFFPFVWISPFLIVDPVNHLSGGRSLLRSLSSGDWRPTAALGVGCLVCGFFWEMWNYWSYPKWIYEVPFVDFARVFEMPALGYLGYIPFALEVFALYHLMTRAARRPDSEGYVRLSGS